MLHLEFADGSTADVATGPRWRAATGPIREADFLMGETYDARLAQAFRGWDSPGFDDSRWGPVDVGAEVNPVVQWHPAPPVPLLPELTPAHQRAQARRLRIRHGPEFRRRRAAEGLAASPDRRSCCAMPSGSIPTARSTPPTSARPAPPILTSAAASDEETWSPRFTFHGFQYVEVTGLAVAARSAATVTGIALSSDTPVAGRFACSDPMLNQLHSNIYWTQRANFIDIPTDCPQRDERLGWTGDAQVYIRTAALNCDVQAFFTKWLVDLDDGQRADGQFPDGRAGQGRRRRRRAGLGRRRRDLPLDDLPGLWRPPAAGAALSRDGPVRRVLPQPEHARLAAARSSSTASATG